MPRPVRQPNRNTAAHRNYSLSQTLHARCIRAPVYLHESVTKGASRAETIYDDTGRHVVTKVDQVSANDRRIITVQRFDALHRLRLSPQIEGPVDFSVPDETQGIKTEYRFGLGSAGRFQLLWKPYRDSGQETMGWTLRASDKLDRPTTVTR